ncbi:hypothetical protein BG003_010687, partial [Podila horticola]
QALTPALTSALAPTLTPGRMSLRPTTVSGNMTKVSTHAACLRPPSMVNKSLADSPTMVFRKMMN